MPVITRVTTLGASASVTLDLGPFNRFGGGGGSVAVRSACTAAGEANLSVLVGSDTLANNVPVLTPITAGITNETPAVAGLGAPSDPITIEYTDTTGGGTVVHSQVDIQNA